MTLAPVAAFEGVRTIPDETSSGETSRAFAKITFIAFTSVTAATGLLCQPTLGSANFATSSPVFFGSGPARHADLWTPAGLATAVPPTAVPTASAEDGAILAVRSDRDELVWVKDNSGLTWDQLGKVFGVSRRAVHLWASGGRMNEGNAEVLRDFAAAVTTHLGGSPEETRSALLAHEGGFVSVVDTFRRAQVRSGRRTIGSPFAPEEKVENIRGAEADEA